MKSQFLEKQVDFGDCRIYYLEGGLASISAPILFLHGWSVSTAYQEILNTLAECYQIIAPELPGFNKSAPLNLFDITTVFEEIFKLNLYSS